MPRVIDLNADLGEGFGPWRMGDEAAMFALVNSANIACGGHASDPETMFATLCLAKKKRVIVGAHPGYPDREYFGRRVLPMSAGQITRMVAAQIGALQGVARLAQVDIRYVKPHGALANLAAAEAEVAAAIVAAIRACGKELAVLAISGTALEQVARAEGLMTFSEIFADRAYLPNGHLVPRSQAGAVLHDPVVATERLKQFLETGLMPTMGGEAIALRADSICIHGDSPDAVAMAHHLRTTLEAAGHRFAPFMGG